MLEIGALHNLGAFAGHSSNCRTTATADPEDGAPHRGERKAEGGDKAYGEKRPEGPTRAGSCQVSRAGFGILEGGSVRAVGDRVRAVVG